MAVNSSPGASSEEDQNKVSPIAERDKHKTENEQWNHDKQFSNSQDDEKGSETTSDRTDPQLFGEGGAGQD